MATRLAMCDLGLGEPPFSMPTEWPELGNVVQSVAEQADARAAAIRADRREAISRLAAGVVHEVNNPLTYVFVGIEASLRTLRAQTAEGEGADTPESVRDAIRLLCIALEGCQRIRSVVRTLMRFSQTRVEQRTLVDVRGLLESAIQMTSHEVAQRAQVEKTLCEVPPVEANEASLALTFVDLLVQSARRLPEGQSERPRLCVTVRPDSTGNVVVEFTGPGDPWPPQTLTNAFDPFFDDGRFEGSGLALAAAHGTIRSFGGELSATSGPRGNTFRVVLPCAPLWASPSHEEPNPRSKDDVVHGRRTRVLVIDDDPLVGEAIARSLSSCHEVVVVDQTSLALLKLASGERFDLLLCEMAMPLMSGVELYAELVRTRPEALSRLVFMTRGGLSELTVAFLRSANVPFLEKPIDFAKLRQLPRLAKRALRE